MQKSEQIGELAAALARTQAVLNRAKESATNPFLKNSYADLGDVWDAAREPMTANGLSVAQFPTGQGDSIGLVTVLLHESGQWIEDVVYLPLGDERGKSQAQVAGSIISYLRRYGLSAVLGIVTGEDDDGNAGGDARGNTSPQAQAKRQRPKPAPANGAKPFYATVRKDIAYFTADKHVQHTMALLDLEYPSNADEAKHALATLAQYATLRADGTDQGDAVALLNGELALEQDAA